MCFGLVSSISIMPNLLTERNVSSLFGPIGGDHLLLLSSFRELSKYRPILSPVLFIPSLSVMREQEGPIYGNTTGTGLSVRPGITW